MFDIGSRMAFGPQTKRPRVIPRFTWFHVFWRHHFLRFYICVQLGSWIFPAAMVQTTAFFPKHCVHPEGFLRWAGVRFLDQGTLSGARFFAGCKFNFSHKSSLVRCPRAFRLRSLTQSVRLSFVSFERIVLLARRARFLSCVHFVWQAWDIRDILGSKTSFGVTGAGHRTLFHPRGTRDTCARC